MRQKGYATALLALVLVMLAAWGAGPAPTSSEVTMGVAGPASRPEQVQSLMPERPESVPFRVAIELPVQLPTTPALEAALKDLGIDWINYHVYPWYTPEALPGEQVNQAMLDMCNRLGLGHAMSWSVTPVTPELVEQSLKGQSEKAPFEGLIWDEMKLFGVLDPWQPPRV